MNVMNFPFNGNNIIESDNGHFYTNQFQCRCKVQGKKQFSNEKVTMKNITRAKVSVIVSNISICYVLRRFLTLIEPK